MNEYMQQVREVITPGLYIFGFEPKERGHVLRMSVTRGSGREHF